MTPRNAKVKQWVKANRRRLEREFNLNPWTALDWYSSRGSLPRDVAELIAAELGVEIVDLGFPVRLNDTAKPMSAAAKAKIGRIRDVFNQSNCDLRKTAERLKLKTFAVRWLCK